MTAVAREISYPQLYVSNPWFSWLTPPPLGRIVLLLVYWAIIIYMMTANAIVKDAFFWERIAYRNAWVTLTQVPLLYLLASKSNVLAWISGSSYERLNWLHRWVARTVFVTASVHGWHFWSEWVHYDFLQIQLKMMPMIKWGLGAWGILLWSLVSGFLPIRRLSYELFVIQHLVSAVLFLWLLWEHVPAYAVYNVWFAVAAICFDRAVRLGFLVWQNVRFRPNRSPCQGMKRLGHAAQLRTVGNSITIVTLKDVHFSWRAGQHLYLWLPAVGPLETHPYTIACSHRLPDACICNSVQLVVRVHGGFSKRLYNFARRQEQANKRSAHLTAFVAGPFGEPPRWDIYETLILISASTGTSFTLPILESVLQKQKRKICTKRIDFLLAARQGEEVGYYIEQLQKAMEKADEVGIELRVHVALTRDGGDGKSIVQSVSGDELASPGPAPSRPDAEKVVPVNVDVEKGSAASEASASPRRRNSPAPINSCCCGGDEATGESARGQIHRITTRPDIERFIRDAVEATGGETSVVVCAGRSLVAKTRNFVARLSDERAVHKGTGAQGIHLFVEEYCF